MDKVLKYYGLAEEPFTISPDPRYLYLTPQHEQVLLQCKYTIEQKSGLAVISGDIGTGKTTIARHIAQQYADKDGYKVAMLINPDLKTDVAFLRAILAEYNLQPKRSHSANLNLFRRFAAEQWRSGSNLVIFVDEAQLMTPKMMEVVRAILNFESNKEKFIQIILFGQNELAPMIDSMRAIKSRVNAFGYLTPLDDSTIEKMIAYRWSAAGADMSHPFPLDAIQELSKYSRGLPREIIKLCNLSIQRLFINEHDKPEAERTNKVHPSMVSTAAKELRIEEDK